MVAMISTQTSYQSSYHLLNEKWVKDTVEQLDSNTWHGSQPLCVDTSSGWSPELKETGIISILEALSRNTSAQVLTLKNVTFDSSRALEALETMLKRNKALLSITMQNVKATAKASKALPSLLFTGTISSHLEELKIEKCRIDSSGSIAFEEMILSNRVLKSLVLCDVICESGLMQVASSFCNPSCGLQKLEIENTKISHAELASLLDSLASNKSITHLSLENLNLGLKEAPQIAKILQHNNQLKSLQLRGNNLNGKSIEILAGGLGHNKCLQALSLAFNPVGDDGAKFLTDCLVKQNTNIHVLDLDYAEIWHNGCVVLAEGLSQVVGLERLGLEGNDMENCGPVMLQSVIANLTLTHISGTHSLSIGHGSGYGNSNDAEASKTWKKVEYFLRLNRAGRRMLANAQLSLWPHVLEGSKNDVDILYYMLTHAPYIASRKIN